MVNNDGDWGEYFNPMPFKLNFRRLWLPGNPPIEIPPKGRIVGPHKYLSNYRFLQPVPINMYKVSSITVDQDGSHQDIGEDEEVIVINDTDVVEVVDESAPLASESQIEKLPFDVNQTDINWLQYKTDEFVKFAEILNIDISHIQPGRQKRWEILKLIKKALGKA